MIDAVTQDWIRNVSDERAVENGCRFYVLRGAYAVWWIERYCRLYEGEGYAGEPLILWGCRECDHSQWHALPEFDEAAATARAEAHIACVKAGHHIDWQYEGLMRLFGWVVWSDRWKREIRRFRQGSFWKPKKQKKSPTLAAVALYLMCGDGEPGQKVFLCAKNGTQARGIAGKHVVEMYHQSPELREECSLNRNEMQLTHESSRSILRPLSSENSQTQKASEGLNGSIIIDETHVVDRAFVDRISRAGISRSEPLHLEFSTAGDDPDSYGKDRFDYAVSVIDGSRTDQEFFGLVYAAPQDLADEELDKNFDHYAAMANPSMGHTIAAEEIRSDYERSKETIEKLAKFKMYRLNIWQHSSNPWLRMSDWLACGNKYDNAELQGKTCFGGLDLSLKWDTTAFVLLFPWGEDSEGNPRFRSRAWFFLPNASAQKTTSRVPWFQWESDGYIELTDGNITDFPLVRRAIVDACKTYDVQVIGYDERFAQTFAQDLQDDHGIKVEAFPQTINSFAEPMGLFEADVIARRFEHQNNACWNWQAGNATKSRKGLLMKPEVDDVKKIDGIVAAVMARGMAMRHVPVTTSVYETRGMIALGGDDDGVIDTDGDDWDEDDLYLGEGRNG